jgi:hypothetical protein
MNNNITPLTILGNEVLRYAVGQTLDFAYDERDRLTGIVGKTRGGKLSCEIELHYRKDTGNLWAIEVFSVGPLLGPKSERTDVCASSFHIVERDNQVREILSDRTVHRAEKTYQREHLYREYEFVNGNLVTLRENQNVVPALRFEHDPQGRPTAVRGYRWHRSIAYNERGQIKTDIGFFEESLLHQNAFEFAGNGNPFQKFLVDKEGRWALDGVFSVGEAIPNLLSWDDSVERWWFDAGGRFRLSLRGNLDEAQMARSELDLPKFSADPGAYLLDFDGSLDLTMVSPDGRTHLYLLKLSERVPEIIQVVRTEFGRIVKIENCPGVKFNSCVATIRAEATENGFRYVVPSSVSDFPGGVTI